MNTTFHWQSHGVPAIALLGMVYLSLAPFALDRHRRSLWLRRLAAGLALVACIGVPRIGAVAQELTPAAMKPSALASTPEQNHVIVVGFLGGFVRADDPRHPEVRFIRELRQEYPTGAQVGLFENSKVDEAYQMIVRDLNVHPGNPVAENNVPHATILLFGHSWGGSAVVQLARKLDRAGIPVALTVQVDSVAKPFSNDTIIPSNVSEAANFYQVHGLIRGSSRIFAADPEHTRIIGNFRRDYKTEPVACRNFPWYARLLERGHIEIECDPDLWSEIGLLLERHTPNATLTADRFRALSPHNPSPSGELGNPDRMR